MKRVILYTVWTVLLVCASNSKLSAQWRLKSTADFNYYYQPQTEQLLLEMDSALKMELLDLQRKLNYHVNQQIDVFVVNSPYQVYELQKKIKLEGVDQGGVIQLQTTQVILALSMQKEEMIISFRKAAAEVLINEMMTGGSFQDKLKNSNLIYLPDWVIPGLVEYLTSSWGIECDNQMRLIHDEYGFDNFNSIPAEYNTVKGASFWKYLTSLYGEDAIPTMLYMIRLTRKLHAASYYSFQVSLNEIYEGWQKYFNMAYSYDQQKPNPVNGLKLDINNLYDIYVESPNKYYTVESTWGGNALFRYTPSRNKQKKLFQLPKSHIPLNRFSGGVQKMKNEIVLFTQSKEGTWLWRFEKGKINSVKISEDHITYACQRNDILYWCSSSPFYSKIYKYNNDQVSLIDSVEGFVQSISVSPNCIALLRQSTISVSDLEMNIKAQIEINGFQCKQIILANDSTVLFNANENGIWNGQMWNTKDNFTSKVTNYRSNIAFHQYTEDVFVEYLDRHRFSSLFITDFLTTSEFYTYNSIDPSYFNTIMDDGIEEQDSIGLLAVDSLLDYSFQSPINDAFDFTLSNYDSLAKEALKRSSISDINVEAPELLQAKYSQVSLTTDQLLNNTIVFDKSIQAFFPNNLNVQLGSRFSNQFGTKSLEVMYKGLLQPGAHDLLINYERVKGQNISLGGAILHRQRKVIRPEESFRVVTDLLQLNYRIDLGKGISWLSQPQLRWDNFTILASDNESLQQVGQNTLQLNVKEQVSLDLAHDRSKLGADIIINPSYGLLKEQWNVGLQSNLDFTYDSRNWFVLKYRLNTGVSFGDNPTYFVLGGAQNDLLIANGDQSFSDDLSPMNYQLIYGVRGFGGNYRNGSTYLQSSVDLSIDVINKIIQRPISSELVSNLRFIPFADLGLTYYGKNIYDKANNLNQTTVVSSTGTIVAQVRAFKNPLIAGYGFGFGSRLYNYDIRLDYAFGVEETEIISSRFHFSLGYTL